jgi:pimeloyl-ACP methyl ester carboxylesterase
MEEHHERSQLVVVDGVAHAVHKSRPEEVAQIIRSFLDQRAAGAPSETG